MKGGFKETPSCYGFTIIETMIFLAVSGLMFLVAVQFINNKVPQAEFTQGMNNANGIIQTLINNVADGNYSIPPSGYSFDCGGQEISITNSTNPAVGNSGCVFVGKVLLPETNQNDGMYTTIDVAGCQFAVAGVAGCLTGSDNTPLTINEEQPVALSQSIKSINWPGGIEITKLYYSTYVSASVPPQYHSIGAVGFFASLPIDNSGVLVSNSQLTSIVIFPTTTINQSNNITSVIQDINSIGSIEPSGQLLNSGNIVMCFKGSNNQKGSISIGSQNGGLQLVTNMQLGQGISSQC